MTDAEREQSRCVGATGVCGGATGVPVDCQGSCRAQRLNHALEMPH
jgi:hypothetical protein